mmetsp:Transcript_126286/g.369014  ORF Transcript_126286/g.369014 Transcript_126286/m.369014 type:complete len:268 (+) Transcript_126286:1009-1812(+)
MPKPSRESPRPPPAAREAPTPRDSTMGTVAGPVVMAPQSQERPTVLEYVSERQQRKVRSSSGVTMPKMRGFILHRYCRRTRPSAEANPTPQATAVSSWKDLAGVSSHSSSASAEEAASTPLAWPCSSAPTNCRLLIPGSLKVTRMPRRKHAKKTRGPEAFCGRPTPMDSPKGMRPLTSPYLKRERPTITKRRPTAMSQVRIHCSSSTPKYSTTKPVSGTTARLNSRTSEAASKSSASADSEPESRACRAPRDEEELRTHSSSEANSQ